MSRKAVLFGLSFVIILLAAFIYSIVLSVRLDSTTPLDETIESVSARQEHTLMFSRALAYLSSSLKISMGEAAHKLALDGGYSIASPCGSSSGVAIWQTPDRTCIPSLADLEPALAAMAKTRLVARAARYDEIDLPSDLEVSVFENAEQLHAYSSSLDMLYAPSAPPQYFLTVREPTLYSATKPDAHIRLDYTLGDYTTLATAFFDDQGIVDAALSCEAQTSDLEVCIDLAISQHTPDGFTISHDAGCGVVSSTPRLSIFCAESDTTIIADGRIQPITYRFAIYLQDIPPSPLNGIRIESLPGEDGLSLISWDAPTDADITKYRLSLSDASLVSSSPDASFPLRTSQFFDAEISSFFDPACTFTSMGACHASLPASIVTLSNGRLGVIIDTREAAFASVNAIDHLGQEPTALDSSIDLIAEDRLAPNKPSVSFASGTLSITLPTLNIDGSALTGSVSVQLYLKEDDCTFDLLSDRSTQQSIEATIAANPSQRYCIGALAIDGAGNPLRYTQSGGSWQIETRDEYATLASSLIASTIVN